MFALVTGALVGILLRLPIFEQIQDESNMFTDKDNWILPDDFEKNEESAHTIRPVVDNERNT